MEAAIVFIALFATVFGIMYLFYSTRNKERLSLIEKGADATLFNTGKEGHKFSINWGKITLKVGMLAIGIAVGIITAALLVQARLLDEDSIYASMILLFGGLSLVIYYIIERKIK